MLLESAEAKSIIENISLVSDDELRIITLEVSKETKKRLGTIRKNTANQIKKLALEAGLLVDIKFDLKFDADLEAKILPVSTIKEKKLAKESPAKYQDHDNEKNTWSGRGKKPAWLVDKLQSGSSLSDFAIAK